MKQNLAIFAIAAGALGMASTNATAATPPEPCPVSYSHLSLPIKHRGGSSTPTVELSFTNETQKRIERAKFGLIVLDSDGSKSPYDEALTFSAGADARKTASSEWPLDLARIDINHVGEIVYLKSIRFDDGTAWQDDGNQRCREETNFGPK